MAYSSVCFGATSAGSPTDDQYGPIIFLCLFHGSPCCYNKCRIHLILLSIIILLVVSVCMADCVLLHPLLPSLLILSPVHFHLDSCLSFPSQSLSCDPLLPSEGPQLLQEREAGSASHKGQSPSGSSVP